MHRRAAVWVVLGLPQNLACDGRRVALAEGDVLEEIEERVALAPSEVDVRYLAYLARLVECDRKQSVARKKQVVLCCLKLLPTVSGHTPSGCNC